MLEVPPDSLRAQLLRLTAGTQMHIVDIVLDGGPPKTRVDEYPALQRIADGEADALWLGRSAKLRRPQTADLLEAACRPEPMAFVTAAELRELGLLPNRQGGASVVPAASETSAASSS